MRILQLSTLLALGLARFLLPLALVEAAPIPDDSPIQVAEVFSTLAKLAGKAGKLERRKY